MCIKEDVIEWIIRNQFGRRNLTDFQRNEVALKYQDIIAEKMKERMSERGKIGADMTNIGGDSFGHTPIEPTSQRKELAKISGTSEDDISIFICNNKNYMYNLDKTKRWRIKHGN